MALFGDGKIVVGNKGRNGNSGIQVVNPASVYVTCNAKINSNKVSQKFLRHRLNALDFAKTKVNDRDIDVRVNTMMPLLAGGKSFGKRGYELGSRVCVRRWNGFDPSNGGDSGNDVVYVTAQGRAYHESLSCSYLKLSIHTGKISALGYVRSKNGNKYYPCEECGAKIGEICYYTDYGTRAHSSLTCSKLKRTIRTVPRSEAIKKYRPCSKCALGRKR